MARSPKFQCLGMSNKPCFFTGKVDPNKVMFIKFEGWEHYLPVHATEVVKQCRTRSKEELEEKRIANSKGGGKGAENDIGRDLRDGEQRSDPPLPRRNGRRKDSVLTEAS